MDNKNFNSIERQHLRVYKGFLTLMTLSVVGVAIVLIGMAVFLL